MDNKSDLLEQKEILLNKIVDGCNDTFCWGIYLGREWVVVGNDLGILTILCCGAAGASNFSNSISTWQTIDLKSFLCKKKESTNTQSLSYSFKYEKLDPYNDISKNNKLFQITALDWCKYPTNKWVHIH